MTFTVKVCLSILASVVTIAAHSEGYSVELLTGSPDSSGTYQNPRAVNNSGTIIAYPATTDTQTYAIFGDTFVPLYTSHGLSTVFASGINDHNQAVGSCNEGSEWNPCSWKGHADATNIAVPDGVTDAFATDINNSGLVVGGAADQAAVWRKGAFAFLPLPAGTVRSVANLVSDNGEIVGTLGVNATQTVVWFAGGSYAMLPGFSDGASVQAFAINDSGTIVGSINRYAAMWQDLAPSVLPSLPSCHYTVAKGISDTGVMVGQCTDTTTLPRVYTALVWKDGAVADLNTYMPADLLQQGYRLTDALSISSNGIVVALANSGSTIHIARLTPTP